MPKISYYFCILLLFFIIPSISVADEYQLGAGDLIKISVFEESDLTIETLVGDTGVLSYPFLGRLQVKGKTASELQKKIVKGLKGPYLVDPIVTVSILEYRPFFVNGKVKQPGGFPFQPGMTVRKAISLAGGFDPRADKDKIYIVRGDDLFSESKKRINQNGIVKPGDTITVERSFF